MNNKNVTISVIVPIYNSERNLKAGLDSILCQSLRDIEIICVNDGSIDGSMDIIKQISKKANNIKLICQKNQGAGVSRNVGLDYAVGKYVAFFDPDDLYANENVLKKLYVAAEKNNALICGGNIQCFYDNEAPFITDTYKKYHIREEGYYAVNDYQNAWAHTKYIFNRHFLKTNKLYYPVYRRGEDPVFMMKAILTAKQLYLLPETVYFYRQYKKRPRFSSAIIKDLLLGYYRTMSYAMENDLLEPFIDCMSQLRYWYSYVGFSIWDDESYWGIVSDFNKLVAEGDRKWKLQDSSDVIMTKQILLEEKKKSVRCLKKIREASMNKRFALYGMGEMANRLMEELITINMIPNVVVTTDYPVQQFFQGVKAERFEDLLQKERYEYLICIGDKKVRKKIEEMLVSRQCLDYINVDIDRFANTIVELYNEDKRKC